MLYTIADAMSAWRNIWRIKFYVQRIKMYSKMIKIQNLKKIYNGTTVLDIESLDIAPG